MYVSVDAWQVSCKHWAGGTALQGQRISLIHRGMSEAAERLEGKRRSGEFQCDGMDLVQSEIGANAARKTSR